MYLNYKIKLAITLLCASFIISSCFNISKNKAGDFSVKKNIDIDNSCMDEENFQLLCDDLYKFLLSKNYLLLHFETSSPESLGIYDYKISFEDISNEAFTKNIKIFESFYSNLQNINPENLSYDDKILFDSLNIYFQNLLASKDFFLYYEPLSLNTGIYATIPIILTEYPFRNINDVENYLKLLSSLDEYYESIIEFEKEKKNNNILMSKDAISLVLNSLDKFSLKLNDNFMQESFACRLEKLNLSPEQKKAFIDKDNKILLEDFFNAYEILKNGLVELNKDNTNNNYDINRKKYINSLIKNTIYPSYNNIDLLKSNIETNLKKDSLEIADLLKNKKLSSENIYDYNFKTDNPYDTLKLLQNSIKGLFPEMPKLKYELKKMPTGLSNISSSAFYIKTNNVDTENIIYVDMNNKNNVNILAKLAHEAIPGHMYQKNYFFSNNKNKLWDLIANQGYIEGYAIYCEALSYFFDNNLNSNEAKILEKNFISRLGLYAFLDLSINYYGKDENYVATYLKDNYNIDNYDMINNIYNSLLANPCNYLKYYVGYLEIIDLKNEAKKILNSKYSDYKFHKFLLETGPAPFLVIKKNLKNNISSE